MHLATEIKRSPEEVVIGAAERGGRGDADDAGLAETPLQALLAVADGGDADLLRVVVLDDGVLANTALPDGALGAAGVLDDDAFAGAGHGVLKDGQVGSVLEVRGGEAAAADARGSNGRELAGVDAGGLLPVLGVGADEGEGLALGDVVDELGAGASVREDGAGPSLLVGADGEVASQRGAEEVGGVVEKVATVGHAPADAKALYAVAGCEGHVDPGSNLLVAGREPLKGRVGGRPRAGVGVDSECVF